MPDNDNKRPLLWTDDLTAEEYLLRKWLTGGTCRPKYVPSNNEMDMVDNTLYPSEADYMTSSFHCHPQYRAIEGLDEYVMPRELYEYSLHGLGAITDKDLDKCLEKWKKESEKH